MLLAPLLLLIGFVIHPPEPHDSAQLLDVISVNTARWNAAHLMFGLSMVLSIPAVVGLVGLLEHGGRGGGFGLIGASLAIIGVIFLTLFIGIELAMSAIASVPMEQHAAIEPAVQALVDFKGPLPVVFMGLSLNLGLFVLAVGLISMRATMDKRRYHSSRGSAGRGIVQQRYRGRGCDGAAGWPGCNRYASAQAGSVVIATLITVLVVVRCAYNL